MSNSEKPPVKLPCPGRRTRQIAKISIVSCLIVLSVLSGIIQFLPGIVSAFLSSQTGPTPASANTGSGSNSTASLQGFHADPVPDLRLPEPVVSSVQRFIGTGNVVQTDSQNLTLGNFALSMRLVGGSSPQGYLMYHGIRKFQLTWGIEAENNGSWIGLRPVSNSFNLLGTNSSGTYVSRDMQVAYGNLSGTAKIAYVSTPQGPLKWNLEFSAGLKDAYRMVFTWSNVTSDSNLSIGSKSFSVGYGETSYTMDWNDVPYSLNTSATATAGQFKLTIPLGTIGPGSTVSVDPTIATNVNPDSTGGLGRHVFYESNWGNYWVFYINGSGPQSGLSYRYSANGTIWSPAYFIPGWPWWTDIDASSIAVLNSGTTVAVAIGQTDSQQNPSPWTDQVSVRYAIGTITGTTIAWGSIQTETTTRETCNNGGSTCQMLLGLWDVNLAFSSNGYLVFTYDRIAVKDVVPSSGCNDSENNTIMANYGSSQYGIYWSSYCYPNYGLADAYGYENRFLSEPVPADSNGNMRAVYLSLYGSAPLKSDSFNQTMQNPLESIASNVTWFSAVTDSNYTTHLIYTDVNGNVRYGYHQSTSMNWVLPPNSKVFTGSYPALTVDYSTNNVYAFAVQGSSIIMREKRSSHSWSDQTPVFPVTARVNPKDLGSNYASNAGSNSTNLALVWTEGANGNYSAMFAAIPIQTVWAPYGFPADPWDGNGLAPYGQYFSNLGEDVSPSSGMLTIEQTDLSIVGRGLDLDFTRVYTEPYSFLNGQPYNYEKYPWAPMGDGWQLNFPWMNNNTSTPLYVHLWDGEGYMIPSNFWNGPISSYENHQGEHFAMTRNGTGIFLTGKSGVAYRFDPSRMNRLSSITDTMGNSISFAYDQSNRINCLVDTVGRNFLISYSGNPVSGISQVTGTCASPGATVRIVSFKYSGASLANVTDPAGRQTRFLYNAVINATIAPWLVSRITYPTGWYTSYAYTSVLMGTQAASFRTFSQTVFSSPAGATIRKFQYNYTSSGGDHIIGSTVRSFNGTQLGQPSSYTDYSFSYAGMTKNVSDSNHVLTRGLQQRFGVHGEIPKEINIVAYTSGGFSSYGSLTDYYRYDRWGNMIYHMDSSGHEQFNTYYNNQLPLGFYAFADTFSQDQGNGPDNPWSIYNGTWIVRNSAYDGSPAFPGIQNMAWTDIGKSDISLRVQANVTRLVDSSAQRLGIFTHYLGHGTGRWALWLTQHVGGGAYLTLWDTTSAPSQVGSPQYCETNLSLGLYTFNMTISGTSALGTLNLPGGGTCSTSGTFSSTGPNVSATGFGLDAGGYSVQFTNVFLARVDPFMASPGFSNSFYIVGAPENSIHGAIAGTAELQNGAGSTPIETYYSYWGGGELNQEKHRLDPTSGIDPSGPVQWLVSVHSYDGYGNPVSYTDYRGNQTSYIYSAAYQNAYLTGVTTNLKPGSVQISSSYGYNFTTGTKLWSYNANQENTTYRYDILGRAINVTYFDSTRHVLGSQAYKYNDTSNFVDVTNENGWKTRQIYDGLGRPATTDRFLNGRSYSNETRTYDWQNNLQTLTDALGHRTVYVYDAIGRVTNTTGPDGNFTVTYYNDPGLQVMKYDESGVGMYFFYDRVGHLYEVTGPFGGNFQSSWYSYDQVGNLVQVLNELSQWTKYTYDNLNRLRQTAFQDTTMETYSYDLNGNMIKKVDKMNLKTLYSYDSLNRLSNVTYCGPPVTSTSYTYDKNNNPSTIQNQNATIFYAYDGRDRVTNQTYLVNAATRRIVDLGCSGSPGTGTTSSGTYKNVKVLYSYNGEVPSTVTYPSSSVVTYAYDGLGRVSNVSSSGTTYVRLSYYTNDQIKSIAYGNGLTENYTYDTQSRPLNITVYNGNSKPMSLTYSYNKTGTVLSVRGQVNTVSDTELYKYDVGSRLTNATLTLGGQQPSTNTLWYTYDALGNRLTQSINGVLTSYNYNTNNNELTSSTSSGTSTAYGYDPYGNLISRNVTSPGAHWSYSWNMQGNLLRVTNSGVQGLYAYDGLGRRVESVESSTVFYAYHGTETFSEVPSSGSETDYVFAGGLRIAKVTGSSIDYYHNDALGSTRLVTDSSKHPGVVFADNYLPFGQDNSATGSETYKFTGKPVSQTTGLYYYYHRWYDSTTGRFVSPDPAKGNLDNPQSLNDYIYVTDRPTSLTDPTGEDNCDLWNPFTYWGCMKNGVQTFKNYVVQPVANYVNNNLVQPVENYVVKKVVPAATKTATQILINHVVPIIRDYFRINDETNHELSQAGHDFYDWTQSNGDWFRARQQAFLNDLSRLRVKDPVLLFVTAVSCGTIVGLAVGTALAPEIWTPVFENPVEGAHAIALVAGVAITCGAGIYEGAGFGYD